MKTSPDQPGAARVIRGLADGGQVGADTDPVFPGNEAAVWKVTAVKRDPIAVRG